MTLGCDGDSSSCVLSSLFMAADTPLGVISGFRSSSSIEISSSSSSWLLLSLGASCGGLVMVSTVDAVSFFAGILA